MGIRFVVNSQELPNWFSYSLANDVPAGNIHTCPGAGLLESALKDIRSINFRATAIDQIHIEWILTNKSRPDNMFGVLLHLFKMAIRTGTTNAYNTFVGVDFCKNFNAAPIPPLFR